MRERVDRKVWRTREKAAWGEERQSLRVVERHGESGIRDRERSSSTPVVRMSIFRFLLPSSPEHSAGGEGCRGYAFVLFHASGGAAGAMPIRWKEPKATRRKKWKKTKKKKAMKWVVAYTRRGPSRRETMERWNKVVAGPGVGRLLRQAIAAPRMTHPLRLARRLEEAEVVEVVANDGTTMTCPCG